MAQVNTIYVAPGASGTGSKADPAGLQAALDTAAGNGAEDDILYLRQGTYHGTFTYEPASGDGDLEIQGGWNSSYSGRTPDPSATILIGSGTGTVLKINDWFTSSAKGDIAIESVTVRNGNSTPGDGIGNGIGGGIYAITRPPGTLTLRHVIIEKNRAASLGGGCALASADENAKTGGTLLLSDSIIRHNLVSGYMDGYEKEAGQGGGCVIVAAGTTRLTNNLVYGNAAGTADRYPGLAGALAIFLMDGEVILTNSTITGNRVYSGGPTTDSIGGGLLLETAEKAWNTTNVLIANSIIYGNHTPETGTEDILYFIDDLNPAPGSSITIRYSDYRFLYGRGGVLTLSRNLHLNPRFSTNPATRYYLTAGSPCIDAGVNYTDPLDMPTTDLAGYNRPQDGDGDGVPVTNMGCYEKIVHSPWPMFLPAIVGRGHR